MFKVKYKSTRRQQGRRARRDAFYHGQRVRRRVQRVVVSISEALRKKFDKAYRDMIVTGVGWVELSSDDIAQKNSTGA